MFTHSPVDGHLDYFQFFFVIMSKTVINFQAQVFLGTYVVILLGKFLEVELIGCMINVW